jgi:hypothetical protein
MLKNVLAVILILFTVQFSFSQDVFRKGNNALHLGGGYRTIGLEAYGANFSYERSVFQIRKLGYIGVGLTSDLLFLESDIDASGTLRIIYHAGFFRTKVLDIYSGVGVATAPTEKYLFHPDIFLGFRYVFKNSNFGFFSEMGYYASNYKLGVCVVW